MYIYTVSEMRRDIAACGIPKAFHVCRARMKVERAKSHERRKA
jgi:hypothetical protein